VWSITSRTPVIVTTTTDNDFADLTITSDKPSPSPSLDPDRFRRQSISGMTVYEERCGNGCGAPEVYPGI
jgi:hypothetical protein